MAPRKMDSSTRKKIKMQYSEKTLKKALCAIREGKGIRETCREFGIPRSTIQDRLHGRISDKAPKAGPDPILGLEGEQQVAGWIINLAKCGFPIKKQELLDTVENIVKETGQGAIFKNNRPGQKWYSNFLRRHPEISVRSAEAVSKGRAVITEERIRYWFSDLEGFLKENNCVDILDCPDRILNGDETGFAMCPKTGKILGPKGWRNLYDIKRGNDKETLTVLVVFSASGNICPPLVVFPYIRPPKVVVESMPAEWTLGKTESGWMKSDVFFEYIANDFNNWLEREQIKRPVLLFVDGHKSHMSLVLSSLCEKVGIMLYALPPNTTHILQPADVSVFKPLKDQWKKTVREFLQETKDTNVTKSNFCKLFKATLDATNMKSHIVNGFRKCGLYPFDPNQVDYTKCVKNILQKISKPAKTVKKITNDDLKTTRKVLRKLKPALSKQNMDINIILKEMKKLRITKCEKNSTANSSTLSNSTGSEDQTLSSCNLSANTLNIGSIVSLDELTIIPSKFIQLPVKKHTATQMPQAVEAKINEELDPKSMEFTLNSAIQVVTHAEIHNYDNSFVLAPDQTLTRQFSIKEKNKLDNGFGATSLELDAICNERDIFPASGLKTTICDEPDLFTEKPFEKTSPAPSEILSESAMSMLLKSIDDNIVSSDIEMTFSPTCENKNNILKDSNKIFEKHLAYPQTNISKVAKNKKKLPSAISSKLWRQYYEQKDETKKIKLEEAEKKKEERLQARLRKLALSQLKKEKKTIQKKIKKKKPEVKCNGCTEELVSDVDDDQEKNIGCDKCPRWFHLRCTHFANQKYNEVAEKPYECHFCKLGL